MRLPWARAMIVALAFATAASHAEQLPSSTQTGGTQTGWQQFAHDAQHSGFSSAIGQQLDRLIADIIYDPFSAQEQAEQFGTLTAHYQAPLAQGNDVYMEVKTGRWIPCEPEGAWMWGSSCGPNTWNQEIWNERHFQWHGRKLVADWTFQSDWKPEPSGFGLAGWEPVFQPVLVDAFLYVPGFGGSIWKLNRHSGMILSHIRPFGPDVDANTFVSGPLTADSHGNIYYNVLKLQDPNVADPWTEADVKGAWLVKLSRDDTANAVAYSDLVPDAPAASGFDCPGTFSNPRTLPWPPNATAQPSGVLCGSQRPGVNVAPAVAPDGTIYTVSLAHFDPMAAYLLAVNPDLTPKWQASLQRRLSDGCGVLVPIAPEDNPNEPDSCRNGTSVGVDPTTNAPGSGSVLDIATSSPTVLPDGGVLFGAFTNYNATRGHLFKFGPNGHFIGSFDFGWDITPAIYMHDSTYSIIIKDNHYGGIGLYCFYEISPSCQPVMSGPNYITQLDADLDIEWQFQNTETTNAPNDFHWCVNAPAIDRTGVVFVNSEDGNLYSIAQGENGVFTKPKQKIALGSAIGAAYTPVSIGTGGMIYVQNNGHLLIIARAVDQDKE